MEALVGRDTPATIARRRKIAAAMAGQATARAPKNLGEGLAAIGSALAARGLNNRADEEEAAGLESAQQVFEAMQSGERVEGAGGIDARLMSAASNPFLSDGQKAIVSALMQRDLGVQDAELENAEFDRRQGLKHEQALEIARLRSSGSSALPATVQEWEYFSNLSPEKQQQYLVMKRNPQVLNLGNQFLRPDALNPGQTIDARGVGLAPGRKITDDRIITTPGIPGSVPGALPPQGEVMGAPQMQAPPAPGEQLVPPRTLNGPSVQNLPPSPEDVRREAETQRLKGEKFDTVDSRFQQIQENMENALLPATGFVGGQVLSNFGGTAAHDIAADLDTIKGIIGFGELQAMRAASPTGGALGQVSEMENRLLQAQYGSLVQSQSEEQFVRNLQTVRDTFRRVVHEGISEEEAMTRLIELGQGGPQPAQPEAPPQSGWSIQRVE